VKAPSLPCPLLSICPTPSPSTPCLSDHLLPSYYLAPISQFLSSPVRGPFPPFPFLFGLDRHSLSKGYLIKVSLLTHFPTLPCFSFLTLPRSLLLHYTLSLIHREISSKSRSWFIRPVLRGCESRHELMQRKRSRARNRERKREAGAKTESSQDQNC